ncbi:acyl-CoA dehydrogenase family protein, partial [Streptomonospora salina]
GGAAGLLRAGMTLAAVDTALRLTLDFALDRRLYQGTVTDLPHARATLADAFGRLLRADALVRAAARARTEQAGGAPGAEAAALADAAQAAASTALWPVVEDLGVVLGARSYLTEGRHASFARVYTELPDLDPARGTAFGRALLHRRHDSGDAPLWVGDPQADRDVRARAELLAQGCAAAASDTAVAAGVPEERRDALFAELVDRFTRARSFTAERGALL